MLLGQNVNSYNDLTTTPTVVSVPLAPGFATVYKAPAQGTADRCHSHSARMLTSRCLCHTMMTFVRCTIS